MNKKLDQTFQLRTKDSFFFCKKLGILNHLGLSINMMIQLVAGNTKIRSSLWAETMFIAQVGKRYVHEINRSTTYATRES